MKSGVQKRYIIIVALAIMLLFSCKKNEPPKDVCEDVKSVSASFVTYPINDYRPDGLVKDQYYYQSYSTIVFLANEKNADSYEWLIGDDTTRHTGRAFDLLFKGTYGRIPIRLIVKKKSPCTQVKQADTLTRYIHITTDDYFKTEPVVGTYEGSDDTDPGRKYKIRIGPGTIDGILYDRPGRYVTYDFPCPYDKPTYSIGVANYYFFHLQIEHPNLSPACSVSWQNNPSGIYQGYLKDYKDTLCIHYQVKPGDDRTIQKKIFTGVRVR